MSFSLGGITLTHGLVLAPMAGAGDASFRSVCRSHGAEYTVTEMLSAKALCYEQLCRKREDTCVKTALLARISDDEVPCAVQLFGSEPEFMAKAAELLTSGEYRGYDGWHKPAAIDINMGCPVHKIVSNGEGSALMKNLPLAERIIKAVCDATTLPVTVKMRAGWNAQSINAPKLAKIAEDCGAAAVCVHARTRSQMYAPRADWEVITSVKSAVSIPVIGNGDIYCAADAQRMLSQTGCDGVAIARGALGNPWLFEEIASNIDGRAYTPPDIYERMTLALSHAEDIISRKGIRAGFAEARPHLAWYIKGVPGSAGARDEIMRTNNLDEVKAIFERLAPTR